MDFKKWKPTRRQLIKAGLISGAGMMVPWRFGASRARGAPLPASVPLNDPSNVLKFVLAVPDALSPGFKYTPAGMRAGNPYYQVGVGTANHVWGTTGPRRLRTTIYGYGQGGAYTWPGMTFEVQSGKPVAVQWQNNLPVGPSHILPVDTSLHWCYSLHGYEDLTIEEHGVPIVVHLHGGHTEYLFDGNPEQFFTPNWRVRGPRFRSRTAMYRNDRPAGNLWYHDHALGITRLNVYAGMAGFYFVRDDEDTGTPDNTLNLPAWPYEKAYAIQDRMFRRNGQLFYPSVEDDPFWEGFIVDEGVPVCPDKNPAGFCIDPEEPTALAEFFGDHMVVNGRAWPVEAVEPRNYRMHLLNGTDSRFMAIQFFEVPEGEENIDNIVQQLSFDVIGSDQGLASDITTIPATVNDFLLSEPGSRYDIILDFSTVTPDNRVIMWNIGGDEPFGGEVPGPQLFEFTDRIMAFDVNLGLDDLVAPGTRADVSPTSSDINFGPDVPGTVTRTRKVALFEGKDEYGRLQPLLGTAEPATDFRGRPIYWPDELVYSNNDLTGPMEGAIPWHSPTTENPALGTTEEWEIWNVTGDAHPVHLHLVHFEVLQTVIGNGAIGRQDIAWDTATGDGESDYGRVADPIGMPGSPAPNEDGTYLVIQPVVQHNGELGTGFKIMNKTYGAAVESDPQYVEDAPKDMVTALPDQITRIKATFDKPGRYVWHCHILSHEDHEMMRVLHVGGGA